MGIDGIEYAIPKTGLINSYMEYTRGNEICPRFRVFSFTAAIGALVRRRVSFQRSSYNLFPTLFPNLWIILVAPQGRGHKSAALSIARKLIYRLPEQYHPRMMASKVTPEALVKTLASATINAEILKTVDASMISILKKPAQALLYSSELGVLLGKEKYNQGMIALLTDLYDTPNEWKSETVMRGDQVLYDVCLSVMGASTPDWMQTMLPADAFKGGFMSRMLLIGYPETWSMRIADPPIPDEEIGSELLIKLEEIAKLEGPMNWTNSARDFFMDWYEQLEDPEPGPKAAYLERKQDHLLRLAMIIELCKAPALTLSRDSIEQSLTLLNSVEADTLRMVEYISVEPRMRFVQRIVEILEFQGTMPESELLGETWKHLSRPSEFAETMQMLLGSKRVKMTVANNEVVYTYIKKESKT